MTKLRFKYGFSDFKVHSISTTRNCVPHIQLKVMFHIASNGDDSDPHLVRFKLHNSLLP